MTIRERLALLIAGKQTFGIPQQESSAFIDRLGIPATPNSRELNNSYKGITYTAVSYRAEQVAQIENYATLKTDKTKRVQSGILNLLENPNPSLSKTELLEAHQSFMDISGECFWYFALGETTKKPKEIYLIRPDKVKVIVDKGEVTGYKVSKENSGEYILLSPFEVYHFKYFNPNNAYRGLGPLQAGLEYVQTEDFATKFTRNFLYNNATPAGVISLQTPQGKAEVSKEAYDKFKRDWRDGMSGAENAGKVAVVRGMEVNFTKVGLSLGDIDLRELRKLSDEAILRMFKVPKALLGQSDEAGLGRGNIEVLEYIFAKNVTEPNMKRIDIALTKLENRFYGKSDKIITHTNIIPEDREFELNYKVQAVDKWITRDEIRETEGREKTGSNELYIELNKMPLSPTANKKIKFVKSLKEVEPEPEKSLDWDVTDKSDTAVHEVFRKNTIERLALPYVKQVKKEMNRILKNQEEKVLSRFGKKVTAKEFEVSNLDLAEENNNVAIGVTPIIRDLALETGEAVMDFINSGKPYEMQRAFDSLISEHILKMASSFNEDTIKAISETLAIGFGNGEGTNELIKRVKQVFNMAETWRVERVARNETHWASVNATEQAYLESDYVKYKKWYANPGACQFCLSMDGKVEAVGQSFAHKGSQIEGKDGGIFEADYEDINNSHLHPNCRCTVLPLADKKSYKGITIDISNSSNSLVEANAYDLVQDMTEKAINEWKEKADKEMAGKINEIDKAVDRIQEALNEEQ